MTRTVLLTTLRNEGPFTLEWVAYHRLIGFDEIIVCFNDCDDGSEELVLALDQLGWITAQRNDTDGHQTPMDGAIARFRSAEQLRFGDWVIWLDLDEFLNIHVGDRTLPSLLDRIGAARALLASWRLFGDGNGAEFAGRFIAPAFTTAIRAGDPITSVPKTLYRHDATVQRMTNHRPIYHPDHAPEHHEVLLGDGSSMHHNNRNRRWRSNPQDNDFPWLDTQECRWDWVQINHYTVRTRQLFALKAMRGRIAASNVGTSKNRRHTDAYFAKMNRNEDTDTSILYWQDAVTAKMAEALQNPAVAAAQALVEGRLAENLRRVAAAS